MDYGEGYYDNGGWLRPRFSEDKQRTERKYRFLSVTIFKKQLQQILLLLLLLFSASLCEEAKADGTIAFNGTTEPSMPVGAYLNKGDNSIDLTNGSYTVTGSTSSYRFWIRDGNTVTLTLNSATIQHLAPIELAGTAKLTLMLSGNSTLRGEEGYAGIAVSENASLIIQGSGRLYVYGGKFGAGIGGSKNWDKTGRVEILGGGINTEGGFLGAGIGGGGITGNTDAAGHGGTYIQSGGSVVAYGGDFAAGVGGGGASGVTNGVIDRPGGDGGNFTFSGGELSAYGRAGGAGIGGGSCNTKTSLGSGGNGGRGGTVTFSGGNLDAYPITKVDHSLQAVDGIAIGGGSGSATGTYNGHGGEGASVKITGGSLIDAGYRIGGGNTKTGNEGSAGTLKDGSGNNVYRVSIDRNEAGLDENNVYACSYNNGVNFTANTYSSGYHFWMPATATFITINEITMPVKIETNNNNKAPIVWKDGSGTLYYKFDDIKNSSASPMSLQFNYLLREAKTFEKNVTFDLNGKELRTDGNGLLTVPSGVAVTLTGGSGSKINPPVNMTGTGLVKVEGNAVALPDVSVNNQRVYFTTITTPNYGTVTADAKYALKYDGGGMTQYAGLNKTYYAWVSGVKPITQQTADGPFFKGNLAATPTSHYLTLALKDYTTDFNLKDGPVTVLANGQITYGASGARMSENVSDDLTIHNTSATANNVTANSSRTITFDNGTGGQLSAVGGMLTLKGSATFNSVSVTTGMLNLASATSLTVTRTDGFPLNDKILFGNAQSLPAITLAGTKVWATKLTTNYGVLADVKHGTTSLTKGQRYFGDASTYYFWLGDSNNDLTFTAGSPIMAYYATHATPFTHDKTLTTETFKAKINTTFYKGLTEAFDAVTGTSTVLLMADYTFNGTATLKNGTAAVTLDLQNQTLNGTNTLNVGTGNTLKLTSSGTGRITGTTTLVGTVYTDMVAAKLAGTFKRNNQAVYYCKATLPLGIASGVKVDNTTWVDKGYQSGTALALWLPSGNKRVDIATNEDAYLYSGAIQATHNQDLAVYIERYNLAKSAVSLTTGPIAGKQSVSYRGTAYDMPPNTPISIYSSSSTANGITIGGTGNGTVTLDRLTVSGSGIPLDVQAGTTQMTVSGTCSLTSTTSDALRIASGASLTLVGTASDALTAAGSGIDVNNGGNLTLSGPFAITAANARFKPTATIVGQPVVRLSTIRVYRAQLPTVDVGSITNLKDRSGGDISPYLYVTSGDNCYFWFASPSVYMSFIGSKPDAGTPYTIPSYAAGSVSHNMALAAKRPVASIESSGVNVYYESLQEAFTGVKSKETILLTNNYTFAGNEIARLPQGIGDIVFDLQKFTLSGDKTLDANNNCLILKATNSGKMEGISNLSGLVYTGVTALGTVKRAGNVVCLYPVEKLLAKDKIAYKWEGGADESPIREGKASVWLPLNPSALGTVSFGYSLNMVSDKCGEIHVGTPVSTHAPNAVTADPYVNITRSDVLLSGTSSLSVTSNGVTVADFPANQPVTVYGTGTNSIRVSGIGTEVKQLILRDLFITHAASHTVAPVSVEDNATLHLYMAGQNTLKGGGQNVQVTAGIQVASAAALHLYNMDAANPQRLDGSGRLYAQGGAYTTAYSGAGIGGGHGQKSGNVTIHGGTIRAEGGLKSHWGIGNGKGLVGGPYPEVRVEAGSIQANREWEDGTLKQSFVNSIPSKGDQPLYLVTVNTGLSPLKKYMCTYYGSDIPFPVMTDEYGKCYFWIPVRTQDDKPTATLTDPTTQNSAIVQLVKVDPNDTNVAPIVCELKIGNAASVYHNNLKDAFEAIPANTPSAMIKILTDIDNLSTMQEVKSGSNVTLDLDRYNLDTKNSNSAGFSVQLGGYLLVTGNGTGGTGNIKSTFRISGDIFIDGSVPLTDATPKLDDKAMFRTLVKGLPGGENTTYTYSYGTINNRTFQLHDGLACLWLPDANGELTFRVTQGSNVTDYTAGTLSTNVQRTDAIPASPVGVVARLTITDGAVRDFNNLPDAFEAASKVTGGTISLLANIALTKDVEISAGSDFILNLNSMTLTTNGVSIHVKTGASLTVSDNSSGVKGQLKCDWIADGQLFVASNVTINVSSVVKRSVSTDPLYRVIAGVSNLQPLPASVTLNGIASKVVAEEACFWEKAATGATLTFRANETDYPLTGVNINNNHQDNMLTLGVENNEAAFNDTAYATFAEAWAAALVGEGGKIELLKDAVVGTTLTQNNSKTVTVDLVRYSLTQSAGGTIGVNEGSTLVIMSANGNGRMQVPVSNAGLFFVDASVQSDRLVNDIKDKAGQKVWRTLVNNLPEGMPDEATFKYDYAAGQSGSFYVKNATACLWLKKANSVTLSFPEFRSTTDNVTVEENHANQVIWGQNNVAQVQSSLYSSLDLAFSQNSNQTVKMLKSAVLGTDQEIHSEMKLEMEGYSISPKSTPVSIFKVKDDGSLQINGKGSISTNFQISFKNRIKGSNANLKVSANVNLDRSTVNGGSGSEAYYRVSVTMPAGASGEMTYEYGALKGNVWVIEGEPLTLWLTVQDDKSYDFKLVTADVTKTYLAANVRIISTQVNPVTVQLIGDEAYIPNAGGGSNSYYKTLKEALEKAKKDEEVILGRDLPDVSDDMPISVKEGESVKLNLNDRTLTGNKQAVLDAAKGHLVVTDGNLRGYLQIKGNVFAMPSADMNGLQVSDGESRTVWRTLVKLPAGVNAGDKITYSLTSTKASAQETTNVQLIGTIPSACLWLSSTNMSQQFVVMVNNKEYVLNNVIIASTHGNELDITSGNDPVAEVNGKVFASLASALSEGIAAKKTVLLKKNLTLSSVQTIADDLTLDLGGFSITSGNGGFSVAEGKKLTLQQGLLLGTMRLNGKGTVFAGNTIKIAGIVLNTESKEVYRTLVKVGPAALIPSRCLWLETAELEYDVAFSETGAAYQVAIPAGLSNHNTILTAYPHIQLTGAVTWQANYAGTNLELMSDALLTIPSGIGGDIHRLTVYDGARVVFTDKESQVRATEGIRYVRSFPANVWESVALPFTAIRITTVDDKGTAYPVGPAYGAGTAGHFWLRTIDINGKLQTVNNAEMTANVSYLMAVPADLSEAVTFISGPNQLLRRSKELAVKPTGGFASYANGTFDEISVDEPCYLLAADGTTYVRHTTALIPPFRGYLLADATTTTVTPELRLGVVTGNEPVVGPAATGNLRIYTLPGRVVVEARQVSQVRVYTVTGYCVRALKVPAGRTEIPLETNVYIVNNTKVWVK